MSASDRQAAAETQQPQISRRSKKHLKIKPSTAIVYASIFALIIVVLFTSYQSPKNAATVANASSVDTTVVVTTDIDDIVAVNIAASVAQAANLPVASNVANLAISTQVRSEFLQNGSASSGKPMVIGSSAVGRSITSYTVKAGDTVGSVAAQFGLSEDTVKWANDLTYDSLTEGTVLQILPIDGVIYEVKSGDTLDSVADKYGVDRTRLVLYNDLDISGLTVGVKIILPNATLPDDEKPGYVTSSTSSSATYYVRSGSDGNRYSIGNCTWYAYERRVQLGLPVGSYWGNANTWAWSAMSTGFRVDNTPAAGAIFADSSGWYGHVAIVESVAANGDILLSEMNNYAYGGWNIVSTRTMTAGQAALYQYIH